jgi:hypothetical protein
VRLHEISILDLWKIVVSHVGIFSVLVLVCADHVQVGNEDIIKGSILKGTILVVANACLSCRADPLVVFLS